MVSNSGLNVSVIIPAYNVTRCIADTLDSVLAQSFTNFEIIIVNDGCPDSPALERALQPYFPHIRYVVQPNGGPAKARNTGIRLSAAPYIALLDGDDLWEPTYLESQIGILTSHPEVGVVYPDALVFGGSQDGMAVGHLFPLSPEVTFRSLVLRKVYVFISAVIRRELLLQVGLFDQAAELRGVEDFDMWLRLAATNVQFFHNDRPLVRYRRDRPESLSQNVPRMYERTLILFEKMLRTLPLSPSDRQAVMQAADQHRAELDLFLGKRALYEQKPTEALQHFSRANRVLHDPRTEAAIWALRLAPVRFTRYMLTRREKDE